MVIVSVWTIREILINSNGDYRFAVRNLNYILGFWATLVFRVWWKYMVDYECVWTVCISPEEWNKTACDQQWSINSINHLSSIFQTLLAHSFGSLVRVGGWVPAAVTDFPDHKLAHTDYTILHRKEESQSKQTAGGESWTFKSQREFNIFLRSWWSVPVKENTWILDFQLSGGENRDSEGQSYLLF